MPEMLGCSTICPNCKHQFLCCPPVTSCCNSRKLQTLSGGGIINTTTIISTIVTSTTTTITNNNNIFQATTTVTNSCQLSPTIPLTFFIPLPPLQPLENLKTLNGNELEKISTTVRTLHQSGWYYESINHEKSNELLKNTKIGTFLLRNSSDPQYLFSLSVQTNRGPTSVRLFYFNGYFRLDAQPHLHSAMPLFSSVIELVQYYVKRSKLCLNDVQVWVDPQGKWYSPIILCKPLLKHDQPFSLKHLARLEIHKTVQNNKFINCHLNVNGINNLKSYLQKHLVLEKLELPASLTDYLVEYPFSL